MKKFERALAGWSKETFGDIFERMATLEDVIKVKEIEKIVKLPPIYCWILKLYTLTSWVLSPS